jgi:antirestriction protein
MTTDISNRDDVIDSRDVIARIEELEAELADAHDDSEQNDVLDMRAELEALQALATEGADYAPDWEHGETLVRDSYFKEYAQQLAEDIGAVNTDATWPNNCIDWDMAARDLRMDYSAVYFDGVTYWIR